MLILDALRLATGEHVVCFLLTAYVETLQHYEQTRSVLPPHVTALPLTGKADVIARLRALGQMTTEEKCQQPAIREVIAEAMEIFAAASRRLSVLAQSATPVRISRPAVSRDEARAEEPAPRVLLPAVLLAHATIGSGDERERSSRNRYPRKRPRSPYRRKGIRSAAQ